MKFLAALLLLPGIALAAGPAPPLIQPIQYDNNYHSLATGKPFPIPCNVDAGDPAPEITWFKDDVV